MKFIRTHELKEGMIIIKPIYRGKKLLLAGNKKLSNDIIATLNRIKYPGVYVYDEFSDYDDFKSLIDESVRAEAIDAIEDLNADRVTFLATDLVEEILSKGEDFVVELNNLSIYDQNTYEHSMNVAITSVACGIGLGLREQDLSHLAVGAMLHDCGKMHVPLSILNKNGKLTDEERHIMERHVQWGYDMLYNVYSVHPSVRTAILCHHENWDGTGYEKHLKGENIPLFARIIHVADVYDALVRERPYKKPFSQSESIENIMAGGGTRFDFECVKIFLKYISIYPVGIDVILSDNRVARVVKNHQGYLERPTVVTLDGEILDLAYNRDLYNITIIGEYMD